MNDPRKAIVWHPVFPEKGENQDSPSYLARLDADVKDILRLGFGRVRMHFNAKDILTSDLAGFSGYGRFSLRMLEAAARAGLYVHLTLPEPIPGNLAASVKAHQYMIDEAAKLFLPPKLSLDVRNEPPDWAAGKMDQFTYELGKAAVKYCDEKGYHARGYVLFGPTTAGWHEFDTSKVPDTGLELFYNLRFAWERFTQNRLGLLQRTGEAFSLYVSPFGDPVGACRLKASALVAMFRRHFTSHPLAVAELGIRTDLFTGHKLTDYMRGKLTGQMLKAVLENPEWAWCAVYDYNGDNPLSMKGKAGFQRGFLVGGR